MSDLMKLYDYYIRMKASYEGKETEEAVAKFYQFDLLARYVLREIEARM